MRVRSYVPPFRRLMGEGCGHLERICASNLDEGADYFIRTGVGREITKEEAYEILKRAEENGLVHEIQNLMEKGRRWRSATAAVAPASPQSRKVLHVSDFNRSNYVSSIDAESSGMRPVRENCQVNALHLGRNCAQTPVPEKERYAS
ncbi:MAG: hypothetical protein ACLVJO_01995 [[Clostridium] scindens]